MPTRPRMPRRRKPLLALLTAASTLGCSQLLGEYEVEQALEEADQELSPMSVQRESSCEPGASRCDEGTLQYCLRVDASVAAWLDHTDCGSAELCSPGPPAVCVRPACQEGEVTCDGATPRRCNAARSDWESLPACQSAANCSTNPSACNGEAPCCLAEPCSPGARRCNGEQLEECEADADGWSALTSCASAELCLAALARCGEGARCVCEEPTCEAGRRRCNGSILEQCNRELTGWDVVSECGSSALCEAGLALDPARCEAPACAPGQFACDGAALRSCLEDRTGFALADQCVGAAFCNAQGGRCELAPCEPGQRSCNGAQVQVCAEDQTGFVPEGAPCATAELCNDANPSDVHCQEPVCEEGQFDCFGGSQLQLCNAGRTGFVVVATCASAEVCSSERGRCDLCVPGRRECTPDRTASRVCSPSGGVFEPETFCPLGCDAATGQCRSCDAGEYRCQDGELERCEDGRSFAPLNRSADCSGGQVIECDGNDLIRRDCAAGFTCEGAGRCECTPGAAFCDDDEFLVCTGTELEPGARCQGEDGDVLVTCDDGELIVDQCNSARQCRRSEGSRCGGRD